MNNWEISKLMRRFPSTKNRFIGVFSADKIPENFSPHRLPCCFIANTDPSWLPGSHWVCVFLDKNGNIEYFDSYGRMPMSPKMKTFCRKNYQYNPRMIQSLFSVSCGQFCIFYLVHRCKGISRKNVLNMFDVNDIEYNENLVNSFVKPHPKMSSKYLKNKQCSKPWK